MTYRSFDRRTLFKYIGAATPLLLLPEGAWAQEDSVPPCGMIEIGSSGVKVAAYRFANDLAFPEGAPDSGFKRLKPVKQPGSYQENPEPRSGKPEDIAATAKAVARAVERLSSKEFGVDKNNITIVASSGVANAITQGIFSELSRQVTSLTGLKVDSVNAEQEAKLSFDWIVLGPRRSQVLLADIGSGNTKGGYYENADKPGQKFQYFELRYGTKSYAKKLHGLWSDATAIAHAQQGYRSDPALSPDLTGALTAVARAEPGIANRPRVYLSGGIAWATALLTQPDQMADKGDWVRLRSNCFSQVIALCRTSDPYRPAYDMKTPLSAEKRAWVESQIATARKIFTVDELAAGAAIGEGMAADLKFSSRQALFFPTFSVDAWSSQYLFNKFVGSSAA